jgi:hypothetical protein
MFQETKNQKIVSNPQFFGRALAKANFIAIVPAPFGSISSVFSVYTGPEQ